jgi:hypothetical protein
VISHQSSVISHQSSVISHQWSVLLKVFGDDLLLAIDSEKDYLFKEVGSWGSGARTCRFTEVLKRCHPGDPWSRREGCPHEVTHFGDQWSPNCVTFGLRARQPFQDGSQCLNRGCSQSGRGKAGAYPVQSRCKPGRDWVCTGFALSLQWVWSEAALNGLSP